jgi:transposase
MFFEYFSGLVETVQKKYPGKKYYFVMDNLYAHKTSLLWHIMQNDNVFVLYTPSASPQLSPIENMFGKTKTMLRDYKITNKKCMASKISEIMFGFD